MEKLVAKTMESEERYESGLDPGLVRQQQEYVDLPYLPVPADISIGSIILSPIHEWTQDTDTSAI